MAFLDRPDGARLYHETTGSGPVVLLTHGFCATSAMWARSREALTDAFTVVTWDMRGHGKTTCPPVQGLYSEETTLADMEALLDAAGAEMAVLGGLSLGGYMSLAFHRAHPERVRALMLFDTGPGYRRDEARDGWNAFAEGQAQRLEERGLDALGESAEVKASHHASAEGLVLAARGMLVQRDGHVLESLPSIRVPTLALWGENDTDFVPAMEAISKKVPGAKRVVVPDAGHAVNLDQPDAFERAVRAFLDDLE